MNNLPPGKPVAFSLQQVLDDVAQFARREPATTAVVAAFGAGLLLNLLPTRAVARTVTAVGSMLMRPALLSLGLIKAVELCCQKTNRPIPT
ncbi:MAG: hypothetical protein ACOYOF_11435 [Verrucomicrobiaceae bacterium]